MVHGGPQEGGGQVVKADQQTLDPCEEENDDLPLAIVTHLEKNAAQVGISVVSSFVFITWSQ